jgi:hypothetical protein
MQLFLAMVAEHRPAAELLTVGRMVGEEKKLILDYWVERLKALPLPPQNADREAAWRWLRMEIWRST